MTFEVFHIKFKGSKTIPRLTLEIYKDNSLSLGHPKSVPQDLRDHYGPKLASDIAPSTMRILPQVLIGINHKHIHPLLFKLPRYFKTLYPNLSLYQSILTGKLLIFG